MARRLPTIALVLAVAVGGTLADRYVERPKARTVEAARGAPPTGMPTVAAADAVSSTWFCPGGATSAGAAADATIVLVNTLPTPVAGTVTVAGAEGDPVAVPVELDALSRAAVRLGDHTTAPSAAALVELDGGGVAVEQQHDGPLGFAATPCSSSAADEWLFAEGSTAKDASLLLHLYNPFPDDAIADLSFATDQGRAVPADFQGVVVPAGRLTVVDVGSHVRRREAVATRVRTRTGRIVVTKLQARTAPGIAGLSATLGAPGGGTVWSFPEGFKIEGAAERVHVFNPGAREAAVDVELALDQGAVEPFELTVPPGEQVVLDLSAEELVPFEVPHAITVRSVDGSAIVAERVVVSAAPKPRQGRSSMLGARLAAERWVTAVGAATPETDQWLVVANPGRAPARVDVRAIAGGQTVAVEGLQDVAVPAGGRVSMRLGDHIQRADLPLLVDADRPVVVERDIYRVAGLGLASSAAVPVGTTATRLR